MQLTLLHQSDRLVAVDKPPGLAVIPGRGELTSALQVLAEQLGLPCRGTADPRVRVVHRLDKDTSGVLLFALDTAAQRHLSHQFQNNQVRKEYLALVQGRVGGERGTIDAPVAPHPTDRHRMCVTKHGRPALTEWQVERRFRTATLLRVFPRTGKTHQIRVHLQSIGLPLLIDPLYNPRSGPVYLSRIKPGYRPPRDHEERPLMGRLTLHAERLVVRDPTAPADGPPVLLDLHAPLPKDFRALLNQLGKLG